MEAGVSNTGYYLIINANCAYLRYPIESNAITIITFQQDAQDIHNMFHEQLSKLYCWLNTRTLR